MPGQWVWFRLKSNNKTIGPQYSLIAQENITNHFVGGQPVNDPDTGVWRPSNPNANDARNQSSDNCYKVEQMVDGSNDYAVWDFKTNNTGVPGFIGPIVQYDQAVRIIWRDSSGGYQSSGVISNQRWYFNGIGQDDNGTGYWNDSYLNLPNQ